MKRVFFTILAVALTLPVLVSCSVSETLSPEEAEFIAQQIADSVADPEAGISAELNSVAIATSTNTNTTISATITYTFTNLSGLPGWFSWDPNEKCYKRSGANISISTPGISGNIISFESKIWFFESSDATGEGVQFVWPYTMVSNPNIHSAKVFRTHKVSLQNNITGASKTKEWIANYTVTGINDTTEGIIINGTRTSTGTFYRTRFTNNFTISHTFENVVAIRTNINGTNCTVFDGYVKIELDGKIETARTSKTRRISTTVEFRKTRQVTVTVEGRTVTVDIVTGKEL